MDRGIGRGLLGRLEQGVGDGEALGLGLGGVLVYSEISCCCDNRQGISVNKASSSSAIRAVSGKSLESMAGGFESSTALQLVGELSLGLGESLPKVSTSASEVTLVTTSLEAVRKLSVSPSICFVAWVVMVSVALVIEVTVSFC